MPLRPCLQPGCPELVRAGRCQRHQAEVDRTRQAARAWQPGRSLYFTARWRDESRRFLSIHTQCSACSQPSQLVDHIRPHRGDEGLFWDPRNWQPMCRRCHGTKTAKETWNKGTES